MRCMQYAGAMRAARCLHTNSATSEVAGWTDVNVVRFSTVFFLFVAINEKSEDGKRQGKNNNNETKKKNTRNDSI